MIGGRRKAINLGAYLGTYNHRGFDPTLCRGVYNNNPAVAVNLRLHIWCSVISTKHNQFFSPPRDDRLLIAFYK
jgi:hypothetical protein